MILQAASPTRVDPDALVWVAGRSPALLWPPMRAMLILESTGALPGFSAELRSAHPRRGRLGLHATARAKDLPGASREQIPFDFAQGQALTG